MYQVALTESYFPAQSNVDLEEITMGAALAKTASEVPDQEALIEVDMQGQLQRRWSYAELHEAANELAEVLLTHFKPGERITVWSPNTPEWVILEYACGIAGVILVTANPAFQAKELRYVLEQSGSSGLYLEKEYRGNPMAEIASEAVAGLENIRITVDMQNEEELYSRGKLKQSIPEVKPGDAVMIQYTSGTTGFPKGAVLSHRGLLNNARLFAHRQQTKSGQIWANIMPMFHTSGCAMSTLGCMQTQGRLMNFKIFDPVAICRLIESERISMMPGVPTMLVAYLEVLKNASFDVSSVECFASGGAMVAPELVRNIQQAFDCGFVTVYGQTETSPVITQHFQDDALEDRCNTIGQPLPHTEVSIRRVETNQVAPIGEIGEICTRGYLTMIGYHDNDQATKDTIDQDGWLHTGDLGSMDSRGYVTITGRVKEMIIRGGENLFPAEIENTLLEHPAIEEVAVVGLPDDKWGEIVACFYRTQSNQRVSISELRAYCRQHLSAPKTPAVWCAVDEFPLTGSGKIQKFALRDQFLGGKIEAQD